MTKNLGSSPANQVALLNIPFSIQFNTANLKRFNDGLLKYQARKEGILAYFRGHETPDTEMLEIIKRTYEELQLIAQVVPGHIEHLQKLGDRITSQNIVGGDAIARFRMGNLQVLQKLSNGLGLLHYLSEVDALAPLLNRPPDNIATSADSSPLGAVTRPQVG